MNITVFLQDIYIEAYPLITNATLHVDVISYDNAPPRNTTDSDWDAAGGTGDVDFDAISGTYRRDSGRIVTLSSSQMDEICEECYDQILEQIKEYLDEYEDDCYE